MGADKMFRATQADGAYMMRGLDERIKSYAGSARHEQTKQFMQERHQAGSFGKSIGSANLKRVREYLATHIGATNRECGEALQLSEMAVGRHVKTLRKEWTPPND